MKTVFVTGGLGFIGSHTCVELQNKGYSVIIADDLSNSQASVKDQIVRITGKEPIFVEKDISLPNSLNTIFEEYEIDAVIHFAAHKAVGESVVDPLKYYNNNINSLLNILDKCNEFGIDELVFSSSCTVYGQPDQLPVTELTPKKQAESPYGNTKRICEEILEDHSRSNSDFKAISLRYFNPAGAHESALIGELPLGVPNNLVPFITQTAAGIRKQLKVFGGDYDTPDGTCIRDYIHVVDLARAHISALEYLEKSKRNYDFFNVGTGIGYSVLDVINSFEKVSGINLNYEIIERRAGDIEQIFADTKKINQTLGWSAELDLDAMMRSAWKWQQSLIEG